MILNEAHLFRLTRSDLDESFKHNNRELSYEGPRNFIRIGL